MACLFSIIALPVTTMVAYGKARCSQRQQRFGYPQKRPVCLPAEPDSAAFAAISWQGSCERSFLLPFFWATTEKTMRRNGRKRGNQHVSHHALFTSFTLYQLKQRRQVKPMEIVKKENFLMFIGGAPHPNGPSSTNSKENLLCWKRSTDVQYNVHALGFSRHKYW